MVTARVLGMRQFFHASSYEKASRTVLGDLEPDAGRVLGSDLMGEVDSIPVAVVREAVVPTTQEGPRGLVGEL